MRTIIPSYRFSSDQPGHGSGRCAGVRVNEERCRHSLLLDEFLITLDAAISTFNDLLATRCVG